MRLHNAYIKIYISFKLFALFNSIRKMQVMYETVQQIRKFIKPMVRTITYSQKIRLRKQRKEHTEWLKYGRPGSPAQPTHLNQPTRSKIQKSHRVTSFK